MERHLPPFRSPHRDLPWVDVTAAVLVRRGQVLIARRPQGDRLEGKWEFPGGKIEDGETARECLARELLEELGIRPDIGPFLGPAVHRYDHQVVRLWVFAAFCGGDRILSTAHADHRWVSPRRLLDHDLAPADIPVAAKVADGSWPIGEG